MRMGQYLKVNLKETKNMDLEYNNIMMEEFIKVNGGKAKN
jgi:hypothetical protein